MSENVLIQGEQYSFHDQAAGLLGIPEELREPAKTHDILFRELHARENGRAVVAFVNTTKGRIGGSYEQIMAGDSRIIGRVDLDIVLPLYGLRNSRAEDIAYIHTQSHAMEQCVDTVAERFPGAHWIEELDTAASAHTVQSLAAPRHAAITPHSAGRAAGLVCLVEGMQDRDRNVTSFYMLGRGTHAVVPENSTMTVAGLQRIGGDHATSGLAHTVEQGGVQLLHDQDLHEPSLVVEIRSGGDHLGAITSTAMALDGLYQVAYLGGYAPQAAAL